jgi:hypothetical protein
MQEGPRFAFALKGQNPDIFPRLGVLVVIGELFAVW